MTIPSSDLPRRLLAALNTMGWTAKAFARIADCDQRLVGRWLDGEPGCTPPEILVLWAETMAAHLAAAPPPDWKRSRAQDHRITRHHTSQKALPNA